MDNADNIYVVENYNHRIQKFTPTGEFIAAVGRQSTNPLQFHYPVGIGFNKKNGKLYVCDQSNGIQVLETNLTQHSSFRSSGSEEWQPKFCDVAFDSTGNVYVTDIRNKCIKTFSPDGQFLQKFGTGQLKHSHSIAVHDDMVYVVEGDHNGVLVFSSQGKFLKSFHASGKAQGQLRGAYGVTVDTNGFVLVADYFNNRVRIF